MDKIYADLVQWGERTLKPEENPDIIPVPDIMFGKSNLRDQVRAELIKRGLNNLV